MHQTTATPLPFALRLRGAATLLKNAVLGRPVVVILLLVCAFATARYETFLTPANLLNVLRQNSMVGLLALGMMFAMLSGGIDLSLGAMLAVGAVTAAALSEYGGIVAACGAVGVSALLGLANGLLVARARIQPFIATLVTNMASRGVLLAYTHEEVVRVAKSADAIKWAGRGWVGPIPAPVTVLLACYAAAGAVLAYTRFGRHVHAVGDNDEAARLMGLDVVKVRTLVYALSGALGGLAGVLLAGRLGVGQPTAGLGWELTASTAVIIGAITPAGWRPGAFNTLAGLLLLAVIFNLFNLEGTINSYWQWVLRGVFLLFVVAVQGRLSRR
jgi:ribose/xylose/arabinose/galactoside ABC-type transport system permease subunit